MFSINYIFHANCKALNLKFSFLWNNFLSGCIYENNIDFYLNTIAHNYNEGNAFH